jgi:hypothetical protein
MLPNRWRGGSAFGGIAEQLCLQYRCHHRPIVARRSSAWWAMRAPLRQRRSCPVVPRILHGNRWPGLRFERRSIRGHFLDGVKYLWSTPGARCWSPVPGFLDRLFVTFLPVLTHNTTPMAESARPNLSSRRRRKVGALAPATMARPGWGAFVMPVARSCAATWRCSSSRRVRHRW